MPLVLGLAVAYSPLLYRPRECWETVARALIGDVIQPRAAREELEALDDAARRVNAAFGQLIAALETAQLDALVVLYADRGRAFDEANFPQIHVFVGEEIWGDPALAALDEPSARAMVRCEPLIAALIAEELTRAGFDISESSGAFKPIGDPERGAEPALIEPLRRLAPRGAPR